MKKKLIVSFSFFFLFIFQASAFVTVNDLDCAFKDSTEKAILTTEVVTGSLHFLKAKSNIDMLLYEYEKSALQSFNTAVSFDYLEKGIAELEASRKSYNEALLIGTRLGYSQAKSELFQSFNYDDLIQLSNYNQLIATKVKNYLSKGDILGLYKKNIENLDEILDTLYAINDRMKSGKKPEITLIWRVFQQYSEAALFGNYATVMGRTVLGNCNE